MIGTTLAHYEIEGRLGEGGSGVVYRGRDLRLDREVAIKVLADALRDDELAWARLLREARLASQLNHPHIAAIYDLGEEDGCAYIVMEYVEGLALSDIIPFGGMPSEQLGRYMAQIGSALGFAHDHGVIHGDLKGSNIIVTSEGDIKLLDFGLGRRIPRNGMAEVSSSCLTLADGGATAGTLPYLAPEVLRGHPSSRESDVWALGVLLYQMATGELPFSGGTPFELSVEIMVGAPAKLEELPEPLRATLRTCLEKDPKARRIQARELNSALAGSLEGTKPPLLAGPDATPTTAVEPTVAPLAARRHRWLWAAAAIALGALLLAGVYARHAWVLRQAPLPSPQSQVLKAFGAGTPGVEVWVNTNSGTYHCPGTRWYGKTHAGEYMMQKQAQDKGYHPAADRACM
ncbi:MAG: serine/threonine-protein kinase [Terriglobia bacterium]